MNSGAGANFFTRRAFAWGPKQSALQVRRQPGEFLARGGARHRNAGAVAVLLETLLNLLDPLQGLTPASLQFIRD